MPLLQKRLWKPSSPKQKISPGENFPDAVCVWLYRIYNKASQENHERHCRYGIKMEGERFHDMDLSRNSRANRHYARRLTEDDLREVECFQTSARWWGRSSSAANELTADNLVEEFWLFKTAFDFFYNMGPSMIWALKLKQTVGYRDHLNKT